MGMKNILKSLILNKISNKSKTVKSRNSLIINNYDLLNDIQQKDLSMLYDLQRFSDPLMIFNHENYLIYYNEYFCNQFMYKAKEKLGSEIKNIINLKDSSYKHKLHVVLKIISENAQIAKLG